MTTLQGADQARPRVEVFVLCFLSVFAATAYPTIRCFASAELSYNEGWNIYNSQTVAAGRQLYPQQFSFHLVNYPALSFVLEAALHRFTGSWLLSARLVSLVSTIMVAWLAGAILRALGVDRRISWLGAAFALMIFCISATAYVGVDDPQMLAEAGFMLGLLVYVRRTNLLPSKLRVAATAVLFVIAGCIKQSPLEFPLAVLLDLFLLSAPLAGWFLIAGGTASALAVLWNVRIGGPGFIQALMLQRDFSTVKSLTMFQNLFGPLFIPTVLSIWAAVQVRRDPRRRVLALLLLSGLVVGFAFAGGTGVSVNAWFGAMIAVALLAGWSLEFLDFGRWHHRFEPFLPLLLFAWMIVPAITEQVWNPFTLFSEQRQADLRYGRQLELLREHPGPALCESLLRCEEAGKPYVYDPFNATRLIESGKLDEQQLLQEVRQHKFSAVQMHSLPPGDSELRERFPVSVMDAISISYHPAFSDEDGVILLPNKISPGVGK